MNLKMPGTDLHVQLLKTKKRSKINRDINIDDLIETKFLTPADLKETFYFPKGNIDHMTLSGNQNFDKRTFSNQPKESFFRYFDYDHIYYCGAGSFPCGSVAGTPGYMCAKHIINFN